MADRYDRDITDLKRRVSNGVIIGTVSKVDHKKGRYRVKAGDFESDWIAKTEARAGNTTMYSSYEEGEQVILASPSGDLTQAVIIGAIATGATQAADAGTTHRIKYPDGTVVEYDHESKTYKMDVAEGGSFALNIGGGASVVGAGSGLKLVAPGGLDIESAYVKHNGVEIGETHKHTDVTEGGDVSGPPVGG